MLAPGRNRSQSWFKLCACECAHTRCCSSTYLPTQLLRAGAGDPDSRSSPSGVISPSGGSRASLASLRNLFARPVPEQALSGPLNKAGSASGHEAEQAGVSAARDGQSCDPVAAVSRAPSSAAAQQGASLSRHQSGAAGAASGAQPPAGAGQGQLPRPQAQAGPIKQDLQARGAPSRQASRAGVPDAAARAQRPPPSRHTSAARLPVPAEAGSQAGGSAVQAELPPSAAAGGRPPPAPAPAAVERFGAIGVACSGFEGTPCSQNPWGPDLRSRIPAAARSVSGQQGPVSAVLAASMGGIPTAFCVGHGASLRMFNLCSQARVSAPPHARHPPFPSSQGCFSPEDDPLSMFLVLKNRCFDPLWRVHGTLAVCH